ncbi:MAG TPA: hypothetical protein VFW96_05080 [Thermomicrobiales bacterium]|nr:hypothetical protein [Thermomicrobiales bacterium]
MASPIRALVAPAAVAAALLLALACANDASLAATAPVTPAAPGCAPALDPGFLLPTPAADVDPRFRLPIAPSWHDAGFPHDNGMPCPPATPGSAPARPPLAGRPQ